MKLNKTEIVKAVMDDKVSKSPILHVLWFEYKRTMKRVGLTKVAMRFDNGRKWPSNPKVLGNEAKAFLEFMQTYFWKDNVLDWDKLEQANVSLWYVEIKEKTYFVFSWNDILYHGKEILE